MKSAYNPTWLHNLNVVKEAKQWQKSNLISSEQFKAIQAGYLTAFYHPNVMIRILLFIATMIAISGVTSLFFLFVSGASDQVISVMALGYGMLMILFLEKIFLGNSRHYKSGVTEALLYHAMGFIIGGIAGLTDFNEHAIIISCMVVFALAAVRYHDLISTTLAVFSVVFFVFYEMYEMGGVMQNIIPIVMMTLFTPFYFFVRKLKARKSLDLWLDCLIVAESLSLAVVYAGGNYLVVRELSIELMGMSLAPGEDIPLAFLFYFLTVAIPILYLYVGIKKKDVVLLRVGLIVVGFSVFTFEFYFSTWDHEITFAVLGAILLIISVALLHYLKTVQHGFTRENILSDKWADSNAEAFIISQTLGGNAGEPKETPNHGGGAFGGGGASGDF